MKHEKIIGAVADINHDSALLSGTPLPLPGRRPGKTRADAFESLPPESPIAMPVQDFSRKPSDTGIDYGQWEAAGRFAMLFGLSLLPAMMAFGIMRDSLGADGFSLWEIAYLALFIPLFTWIAFGFATSLIGFVLLCARGHQNSQGYGSTLFPARIGRTAILVPVCNEDFLSVMGRISIMERSFASVEGADQFDFFILSDSSAANGATEEAAYRDLQGSFTRSVHYRRRPVNHGRKPGNIAEWVQRFGGGYHYMIVLDADSVMSGQTMARLAMDMARRPDVGLIQTIPSVVGATTFFARWQQFASRLYGPVSAVGMIWWSGSEGTFWGHNAIVRIKAFADSCGLPELKGRAPFGGHIMSHDMIEAGLLRRKGWSVQMAMTDDSFEEFPPSLPDLATRDRRWCQGNMQHVPLLARTAGLHLVNRFQLLVGASAYLTSPLWLAMILLVVTGEYLGIWSPGAVLPSGSLLMLTLVLLFGPKLLAFAWAVADPERRRGFGGIMRMAAGTLLDTLLSILMAPVSMLSQTINLASILAGRKSAWNGQSRDCDGIPMRRTAWMFRYHVALGAGIALIGLLSGMAMLWLMPIVAGLLLAPVLASLSARKDLGRMMAGKGVFAVPNPWWQEPGYRPLRARLSIGPANPMMQLVTVANDG